ncbi:ATP-binding protein [Actinoplanes aureus]|uniref:ATP-binding protein n=1 Tax=Actinoplanes aureus TaxID=2792083 RepID=A0A931CE32_9ACTN|nr:ATP-binding protein [Actinoplanes aureus]MBG0564851.1 ATP-binding protein [Actinoplanes aureus]
MSQRSVRIDVPAGLNAPGEARHQVTTSLHAWGFTEPRWLDAVAVVVSELVTNAVQHGGAGSVPITMMTRGSTVLLSVADDSAELPRRRPPDDRGGRGLMLIDALSVRWYVQDDGRGKCVHVELQPYPGEVAS